MRWCNGSAHGFSGFSGWEIVAYTLITTHITIAAVTIFLHRAQAHRALDLHADPVAFLPPLALARLGHGDEGVGRDPPQAPRQVRDRGRPAQPADARHQDRPADTAASSIAAEAKNQETLDKYGHGTPDDWLERNLYSRFSWQGVGLMLIIDLLLFGAIGATVWAVQMLWIPITAAGIINGIGHFWGYRNFEAPDASRNIVPWGIVIGGEELHNNHHTYPTSAKLSVKPHEFDIGWMYIRVLEMLGLATVRKTAPQLKLGAIKPGRRRQDAGGDHRQPLRGDGQLRAQPAPRQPRRDRPPEGRGRRPPAGSPSCASRAAGCTATTTRSRRPSSAHVAGALASSPYLAKLVAMREELRLLWTRTNVSAEQLVADLQAWLRKAEESGIAALQEFALRLRAAHA